MRNVPKATAPAALLAALSACATTAPGPRWDMVLRGGTIHDGSGGAGVTGDVAIRGDRIARVGRVRGSGKAEIDARGLAVAPGFVNMLSWANESLIADGRAESDIRQGVTLEVMGEGESMGPLSPAMKAAGAGTRGDFAWTSLGEYLAGLERRGVSPNIASFVGATTVRQHVLGANDVDPNPEQLDAMRALVSQAMDDGAMGVGSSLIYVPAAYAETSELVALAKAAGKCGGMYISHIRNEGGALSEAVDELVAIAEQADVRAEAYHLKAAGKANWGKMQPAIDRIAAARARGLAVTADMYLYAASGTGLDSRLPLWAREGGRDKLFERLADPVLRARVIAELTAAAQDWSVVQPTGFRDPGLRVHAGKRLPEIAAALGMTNEQAAVHLIATDKSRVSTIFHSMSEDNVRLGLVQPWVSLGSDADARTVPAGADDASPVHPRAYGNFARLLGRYVRDEKLLTLGEAVRKLTALPARNLRIEKRGRLKRGWFADLAVFDPATIADRATFEVPHRYAIGMRHVFVNGVQVLRDGEHTGAKPGRFVKGPGAGKCVAKEGR